MSTDDQEQPTPTTDVEDGAEKPLTESVVEPVIDADSLGSPVDTEAADPAADSDIVAEGPETVERPPADTAIFEAPVAEEPVAADAPRLDADQLLGIVEALVFASPEPLSLKTLSKLLADEPQEDVAAALQALKAQYDRPGGLHVVEIAGGLQITTRPENHEWVRRLFHERTTQKLSVQALETLAVTAYKQPITAAEIGEIRGVNTSGVLSTLLERHLIKIVGRKNVIGRPFLYGTTREFLIRFGLKDLTDLPRVEDMAQALGFDAPAILRERSVSEEMLPLEDEQA